MKALSLFSGIGGIDLACEWAGIKTVAMCEREPFCQKVLRKHWPDVPIYDDVCTLTKERLEADGVGTIDVILSGDPCQPYSLAGNREGEGDDRFLWPEVNRLLETIRPRWIVRENVAGNITLGLDGVLADLERLGYSWQTIVSPACSVGAPHRRDRVFVLAYTSGGRQPRPGKSFNTSDSKAHKEGQATYAFDGGDWGVVANASDESELEAYQTPSSFGNGRNARNNVGWSGRSHESRIDWESIESRVGGMFDGFSDRLVGHRWPAYRGQQQHEWEPPRGINRHSEDGEDRLKALGNAVVPQQIYPILAAIKQIDDILPVSGIEPTEPYKPTKEITAVC